MDAGEVLRTTALHGTRRWHRSRHYFHSGLFPCLEPISTLYLSLNNVITKAVFKGQDHILETFESPLPYIMSVWHVSNKGQWGPQTQMCKNVTSLVFFNGGNVLLYSDYMLFMVFPQRTSLIRVWYRHLYKNSIFVKSVYLLVRYNLNSVQTKLPL